MEREELALDGVDEESSDSEEGYGGGGRCFACQLKIVGEFKEVGRRLFHGECVRCAQCQAELAEDAVKLRKNRIYCRPCHQQLFGARCCRCGGSVGKDELVRVGSGVAHCRCAPCHGCRRPLPAAQQLARHNGHLYCSLGCVAATRDAAASH